MLLREKLQSRGLSRNVSTHRGYADRHGRQRVRCLGGTSVSAEQTQLTKVPFLTEEK